DQDAAELGAVDHEVVRPFQRDARNAERTQRARHADAGDERKAGKLPKWAVYRLRERESHPRAGGRVPAPAATAAARGLLFGRKQHTRDRVLEKERVRRR